MTDSKPRAAARHADPARAERFGPLLLPGGGVRFQAFAPHARRVTLHLEQGRGSRRVELDSAGEGFFAAEVAEAGVGTRYRFSRDGGAPVADPASRWQPRGSLGPSEVIDLAALRAEGAESAVGRGDGFSGPEVAGLCVYELHVGTFSASGDYDGLRRRLDHLVSLGVGAVEIMPLATFPGDRGWGYDGVFHFAPQPSYGSPRALRRLVRACHERGLAVLLDIVTNHFGSRDNAMWMLAKTVFEPDEPTPWASGINWSIEGAMRYFDEVVRVWLRDYDVDGIRFDAWNAIPAAPRRLHLSRMIEEVDALRPPGRDGEARRTFVILESSANEHAPLGPRGSGGVFVSQLNFDMHRAAHALLTGERHGQYQDYTRPHAELARCLGRGFAFSQRHSDYVGARVGDKRRPLPWAAFVNYLENHDTCGNRYFGERHTALCESRRREALLALTLLHPATAFLWMGQEWASERPFYFFCDFEEGFGRAVTRARLREFQELDWRKAPRRAPGPQDLEAFEASRLDWNEPRRREKREQLERTRALLRLRADVVPRVNAAAADAELSRVGEALSLVLPARAGGRPFVLAANLGDAPLAYDALSPALAAAKRRLYRSVDDDAGVDGAALAPWCTELWR